MITVLIVDDHPIVRDGIVALLENLPDIEIAGSFSSAEEAIVQARLLQPSVTLLDLELVDMNGLEAIPKLLKVNPQGRIVIFTGFCSDDRIYHAMKSGAVGYLQKGKASIDEIAETIRSAYEGRTVVDPSITEAMAGYDASKTLIDQLSQREQEVLRKVAEGLPNKQIASFLNITEHTVKYHVTSIFNKLGADNRAQAVAMAVQHGIL